jgi:hypothetical protein
MYKRGLQNMTRAVKDEYGLVCMLQDVIYEIESGEDDLRIICALENVIKEIRKKIEG